MATFLGFSASSPPPAGWKPFAETAFCNSRVPMSPSVLGNSAAMVTNAIAPEIQNLVSGGGFSAVYFASTTDPLVKLTVTSTGSSLTGREIFCPVGAVPAPGSDAHMTVIQPDGQAYDFFETVADAKVGGTIKSVGAGLSHFTSGNGVCTLGGACATDYALTAGVIRAEELIAGNIPHALIMTTTLARTGHIPPAINDDGTGSEANVNQEGQLYTFAGGYTLAEIEALSAAPWTKTIARAILKYGIFVCDKGGGMGIKLASGNSYTAMGVADPLIAYGEANGASTWEGKQVFHLTEGIDWTRLRAIEWKPETLRSSSPGRPATSAVARSMYR